MRRAVLPLLAVLLALAGCGGGADGTQAAARTTPVSAATSTESTVPTFPSATAPPSFLPVTTSPAPVAAPTTEDSPVGFTCAQVGGVFQQNYPDGRGVCVPADPRSACHIPPAQQPDNYLADLTMTPPTADGIIDLPTTIGLASNADCWKNPLG
jgi:hypothetical protein